MYKCPNARVLAGGAGYGGKSYLLRAAAVHHCLWLARRGFTHPVYFWSASYGSLKDRHFTRMVEEWGEWGKIVGNHQQFGLSFVFHDPRIPPILFRNLDDPNKRRGAEGAAGFLDETTEISAAAWGACNYLIRAPGPEVLPILTATNPDGVGHVWVKETWRPHLSAEGRLSPHRLGIDPAAHIYVPFLPTDNPTYDEATFTAMIAHLPEHIRRARREGSWDAPEGARFRALSAETHRFRMADRFPAGIPESWPVVLGIDYGLRSPYACLWLAYDGDGDAYVYREDYQEGLTADQQAARIVQRTPVGERVTEAYLDSAMWAQFPDHLRTPERTPEISAADLYAAAFAAASNLPATLTPGDKRSRVHGLATLDKYLGRDNGYPDLWIEEGCTALWLELSGATFKQGGWLRELSEDIDERAPDHAIDALRYALHTRGYKARVVLDGQLPDSATYLRNLAEQRAAKSAKRFRLLARKGRI